MRNLFVLVLLVTALAGCQSSIPLEIREPVAGSPELEHVRADTAHFKNAPVRWGGKIVKLENKAQDTLVEVVSKPLDDDGRPQDSDGTSGRFLVRVTEFLDPAVYKADRLLTMRGVVEGSMEGKIGERSYTYPVVAAQRIYLWPIETRARYMYDPWFPYPYYGYGPYYNPWGPRFRYGPGMWW
jgi:outer membrane lipoprotein